MADENETKHARQERQFRAAAFWQKTIDEGRQMRQAERRMTRTERQEQQHKPKRLQS
jgi:hypothetical protein